MGRYCGTTAKRLRRLRDEAYVKQRGFCYYCGVGMLWPTKENQNSLIVCTAEHLIERRKGGKEVMSNIVAACRKCNQERDAASYR